MPRVSIGFTALTTATPSGASTGVFLVQRLWDLELERSRTTHRPTVPKLTASGTPLKQRPDLGRRLAPRERGVSV